MLSVLLTILKVIGIIVLALLSLLVLLLLLVLFVPVRYRIKGYRKSGLEAPIYVRIKATWLFRLVRVVFAYPEAAYVKVKVLFFTVYNSSKVKPPANNDNMTAGSGNEDTATNAADASPNNDSVAPDPANNDSVNQNMPAHDDGTDDTAAADAPAFVKIRNKITNIWYTILKIYDRIKDAVFNIRYYIDIIKSDEFKEAFSLCSRQLGQIFRSIKPRRIKVNMTVGMKDPRQTGQILELYSILYPVIGNNVFITPDFDQELVDNRIEGDFYFKGRVSSYVLLWAAWKVYRDKNIRKIIKLLKREGT